MVYAAPSLILTTTIKLTEILEIQRLGPMPVQPKVGGWRVITSSSTAPGGITRCLQCEARFLHCSGRLGRCETENDILSAFPERFFPQLPQLLLPLNDCQKMISSQLTELAGKATGAVRQNHFGFAVATGVEENFARGRVTGRIFKANRFAILFENKIAQWDPAAFS